MSLFRTIFAFENGREVANLGFDFTECLHSGFALPSLCLRSGFARRGGRLEELCIPFRGGITTYAISVWHENLKYCEMV